MASSSPYIVVLVYPNCRMRNGDNGVTFECEDPILLSGTEAREIGRVAYRLLASMSNGVFRFRLFRLQGDKHVRVMFDIHGRIMVEQVMELSAEVGHSGGGPSVHSTYVQDDRPLAPPPIHVAIPLDKAEECEEESDEEYVADSGDSDLSDSGDQNECVPETPIPTAACHVLPPPLPIQALSAVPSYYHSGRRCLLSRSLSRLRDGGGSFCVRLSDDTCDYGLFPSLHYPCRHALAGCAAASIEWAPYVHPMYKQEVVFKVYEMEFPPIPDESMWAEWHETRLCPNPVMHWKAT
ncbi:hypothetical protein Ahy_B05g075107 [Arachis hypogaea]|uniref:SWIM-type domain-containing protein n=1 Tax=Arachis hypogaea TaxID=3818 RepID=A0A444Z0K2_ARAHY|nr:hypothetical protein Ahy_B05g075107 [Arachis hypogaea]